MYVLFDPAVHCHRLKSANKVAMNYRLGAFGWLGGEQFYEDGGTPNVGLLDQALAAKWVESYVYLFGGDNRRKVMLFTPERIYDLD